MIAETEMTVTTEETVMSEQKVETELTETIVTTDQTEKMGKTALTVRMELMCDREVEGVSTTSRSLLSNVRKMFDDVNWELTCTSGFVRALFFHWSLHIMLGLNMFNIIMAIITHAHECICEHSGKHQLQDLSSACRVERAYT